MSRVTGPANVGVLNLGDWFWMASSYQVRVRGHVTERMRRALAGYGVHAEGVDTALTLSCRDLSELQGFLALLDQLGLVMIDMRETGGGHRVEQP